jgi:murein L,D-transpeptidase YcbB/YkuD
VRSQKSMHRRTFLSGAATLAAAAIAGPAAAQTVLDEFLRAPRRGMWNDQFDAKASATTARVQTNTPVFAPETAAHTEQAIMAYQNIVAQGGWPNMPADKKLKLGVIDPQVEILRRRLMVSGDLSPSAGMSNAFDSYVDSALKRFQGRHGLPADGATGRYTYAAMNVPANVRLMQLQTNLVRLKTMQEALKERYVMVNIPAAQIEAVENGRVVQRNTAVVGKVDRQSPILYSKINEVIFNPYWNAPESIVRKDIIPLMRKDPEYLTKNFIRILDSKGNEIDPLTIDWSTEEAAKLRFRQDPGKINAMASVKINFPNPHAVYMHDTPQQTLFTENERFHSSGCVRVQNVRDLVTWILQGTEGWNRQRFEQQIQTGDNTPVKVGSPPAVHFTYVSAWAADDVVHLRDDIYGKDGAEELQLSSTL